MEEETVDIEQQELYEHHRFTVDRGQATMRLDLYLQMRLEGVSRNKVQAAAKVGCVRVNDAVAKSSYKVKPQDVITVLLPEGTRHFALHVKGQQKFMLMVDDITYVLFNTADLKLLGYNVYWADELLNDEPIKETTFEAPWMGSDDYRVTAVYEQGESALSMPFHIVSTGIEEVENGKLSIGNIYDLGGRKVDNGNRRLKTLPKGIYIHNGRKVVVK